jgi:hypothetical protein
MDDMHCSDILPLMKLEQINHNYTSDLHQMCI